MTYSVMYVQFFLKVQSILRILFSFGIVCGFFLLFNCIHLPVRRFSDHCSTVLCIRIRCAAKRKDLISFSWLHFSISFYFISSIKTLSLHQIFAIVSCILVFQCFMELTFCCTVVALSPSQHYRLISAQSPSKCHLIQS